MGLKSKIGNKLRPAGLWTYIQTDGRKVAYHTQTNNEQLQKQTTLNGVNATKQRRNKL